MHHKLVRNRHLRRMELQQKKQQRQLLSMQPPKQEQKPSPAVASLNNNNNNNNNSSGRSQEPARIANHNANRSSVTSTGQTNANSTLSLLAGRGAELGLNDGQSSVSGLRGRLDLLQEQQHLQSAPQGLAGRPLSLLGPGPLSNGSGIGSSSTVMEQQDAALAHMLFQQERQQQLALLERYRFQQQHLQMQSQAQNRAASLFTLLDEQHLQQERRRMLQQGFTNDQDGALGLLSAASLNPGLVVPSVGSMGIGRQSANSQSLMALRTAALPQQPNKRNLQEMSGYTMPNFQGSSITGNRNSSGQDRAIAAALEESLNRNKRARTMSDGAPGSAPLMAASVAHSGSSATQNGNVVQISLPNTGSPSRDTKNAGSGAAMARASVNSRRPAEENSDDEDPGKRFRPYQSEQWTEKFSELCDFRSVKGHCQVPHTYADNPPLARWVKRQRYQYKLKMENKQSTMTDERIRALEEIGFIWDSHAAAWEEKLNELKEYSQAEGNCNVPSTHPENPQLATWVKCQRRQYKLLRDGRTSNMTIRRINALEKIDFVWEVRKN